MRRIDWKGYLFVAPAAVILLAFSIYPLVHAFNMSLQTDWLKDSQHYVGGGNYIELLGSRDFWEALDVSVWYVVGTVPVTLVLSFLLANLLFQKLRALGLYRTIYFLPYVTSTVAAAMVWRWIFEPSHRGVANTVFGWFGAEPLGWYNEPRGVFSLIADGLGVGLPGWAAGPSLALVTVIVFGIWHALGFCVVIFLAGLSAIPRELHEAAEVDGAGARQRLWHVTVPLLSPTLYFLAIISVIRAFQTFNEFYVLTNEQCTGSTQSLTMLIFNQCYNDFHYGLATAAAVMLFLIMLGLTAVQMRVIGRRVHY
jgi:multiple sugar transport system permease protein